MNGKLKTLVADLSLDKTMLQDVLSLRAANVVEVLGRVDRQHDFPKAIRVDQGTEFVSRDLDVWACQRGVTLDFSRPGKPTDNAFIESLNGKFRAECLNTHWFMRLDDARAKCEARHRDNNEVRPHSEIGNKPPISLVNQSGTYGPAGPKRTGGGPVDRSNDGVQFKHTPDSGRRWMKDEGQVNRGDQWTSFETVSRRLLAGLLVECAENSATIHKPRPSVSGNPEPLPTPGEGLARHITTTRHDRWLWWDRPISR